MSLQLGRPKRNTFLWGIQAWHTDIIRYQNVQDDIGCLFVQEQNRSGLVHTNASPKPLSSGTDEALEQLSGDKSIQPSSVISSDLWGYGAGEQGAGGRVVGYETRDRWPTEQLTDDGKLSVYLTTGEKPRFNCSDLALHSIIRKRHLSPAQEWQNYFLLIKPNKICHWEQLQFLFDRWGVNHKSMMADKNLPEAVIKM